MLAMQDASQPFPVQADLSVGGTRAAVVGTLRDPASLAALDLRLKLSGGSMAQLYPLTGVTLPDTPPYSTDGHLVARLRRQGGAVFDYKDFNGKVGNSDLHGDVSFALGAPRPRLTGKLSSAAAHGRPGAADRRALGQGGAGPGQGQERARPAAGSCRRRHSAPIVGATWMPMWRWKRPASSTTASCPVRSQRPRGPAGRRADAGSIEVRHGGRQHGRDGAPGRLRSAAVRADRGACAAPAPETALPGFAVHAEDAGRASWRPGADGLRQFRGGPAGLRDRRREDAGQRRRDQPQPDGDRRPERGQLRRLRCSATTR